MSIISYDRFLETESRHSEKWFIPLGFNSKGEPLFNLVAAKNDLDLGADGVLSGGIKPAGISKATGTEKAVGGIKIASGRKTTV